jgi:GPH family glycoside/pentoside/hexuronide:cation symporter
MTRAQRLPSYGLFAAMLAAAGLPIYIHAPKFYVDEYGLSLTALASVLFVLRLVDVVQDPLLGWLSEKTRSVRGAMVSVAVIILALSMWGLFAVVPPIPALWWFALTLGGLFSSFSFLTISFYAQGVAKADAMGAGHVRLATWRETGGLLGVCVAAITPTVLMGFMGRPFVGFALGLCGAVPGWMGFDAQRMERGQGRKRSGHTCWFCGCPKRSDCSPAAYSGLGQCERRLR